MRAGKSESPAPASTWPSRCFCKSASAIWTMWPWGSATERCRRRASDEAPEEGDGVLGEWAVRGVRGATTVDANTGEAIVAGTRELLEALMQANGVAAPDIASIIF